MLGTFDFPKRCTPFTVLQIKCSGVTFRCTLLYTESGGHVLFGVALKPILRMKVMIENLTNDLK